VVASAGEKKVSNYHVHQKSCTVGTRCLEDRPTPNSMNSCANIPVVCHSDACKFVESQFSDPGGSAAGTCRCAPHPPPQVLSILRTLDIQISTNKRRRLGFVDELVNRNFLCNAHTVTSNAKYVTSGKSVRFVTQSFTKMSRKSNSSLASTFASYPHCDPCSISPCGNEVFGGSTNTKLNEFLCNSCAI